MTILVSMTDSAKNKYCHYNNYHPFVFIHAAAESGQGQTSLPQYACSAYTTKSLFFFNSNPNNMDQMCLVSNN